jgi:hypothetical protein
MFSILLFGSCSSEKTLSEQVKYDWDIKYNSSKDDVNERPYNLNKKLKNSSVQNQTERQISLPTVKNNQDLLASNDKVDPQVFIKNYSYKKLPKIIQKERIYKSFNEKSQIFEDEKIINKKFKINDKTKKILKIIGASILIGFTGFFSLITIVYMLFEGLTGGSVLLLLISSLLVFLSSFFVKKITKSNSKDKKDKKLPTLKQVLLLTLTTLVCSFTGLVLGAYGLFFYGNFFENILTPLGSISLLISTFLIYRSYLSVKNSIERNSKENNKNDVKASTD